MSQDTKSKTKVKYTLPPTEQFREILHQLEDHENGVGDHFTLVEFLKVSARIRVKQLNSVDTQNKTGYSQNNSMW